MLRKYNSEIFQRVERYVIVRFSGVTRPIVKPQLCSNNHNSQGRVATYNSIPPPYSSITVSSFALTTTATINAASAPPPSPHSRPRDPISSACTMNFLQLQCSRSRGHKPLGGVMGTHSSSRITRKQ